jgi:formylglycine-generating enzyme required for sulfatase activity
MQHITPVGAALVARIAGCRLPTAAEWAAARTKGDVGPPNLRDVTWRKVFDRFQGSAPMQQALMAGGFRGAATGRDDGKVASTQDDGVIWLRPTDAGKIGEGAAFRDLVGNVAEFVFESPAALEKAPATAAGVLAVLAKDSIRVIGGSALSPESVEPATPQTLGSANPGIANFSDVGFRLAFTAPRAAGAAGAAERIQGALSAHGYLKK